MDNLGFRTVRPMAPAAEKTKETQEAPAALSRVAVAVDGSVAKVTLQHPPVNVIDIAMMEIFLKENIRMKIANDQVR